MPRKRPTTNATALQLTVVVPTRNEAGNVPLLIQRLRNSLAELPFEIVFVDDSDDHTARILREAARRDPRLRVLHRTPPNRDGGLSTAVVLGISRARGRLVCVMDGDLQHPPEVIPELVSAQLGGADLVIASRYLPGGSRSGLGGGLRRVVSRAATLMARILFQEARASSDPLAGFFLCRTSMLAGLEFRPVGFKVLLELLVCSPGAVVAEVPLQFQPRGAGQSKATFGQGWLYLRHLWSLVRDVPGSARRWKFAAVGITGLGLLLALIELLGVGLGWPALAAWGVAFAASLAWNFYINLRVTFADVRRERSPLLRRYALSALASGGVQLLVFLGLVGTTLPLVLDGLLAAVVGMGANAVLSLQLVRRRRRATRSPLGLEPLLQRLVRVSRADQGAVLDSRLESVAVMPGEQYRTTRLVRDLCRRAGSSGVPVMWTEPPSGRPQARSSVELTSVIVLPTDSSRRDCPKVVLHRHRRTPFNSSDLEAAMRQLQRLGRLSFRTAEEVPQASLAPDPQATAVS